MNISQLKQLLSLKVCRQIIITQYTIKTSKTITIPKLKLNYNINETTSKTNTPIIKRTDEYFYSCLQKQRN